MDKVRFFAVVALSGFVNAGLPLGAHAQELDAATTEYVPVDDAVVTAPAKLPDGFYPALSLGANLNLASNSNVVGQVDGLSLLTGISIAGELHLISGMHDFRNRISLTEAWSKTPTLKRFVKSNDVLDVESLYKLFLWPVGGLYARANLLTTVFATEQVTSEPVTYVPDGGDPADDGQTVRRFELSDPLQPLTVSESLGAFLDPIQEPHLQLSLRAGFGGRHTLADGARLITSDEDPDAIVFETLEDVHQAGLELFGGAGGRAVEDRLRYDVGLVALVPFINNDDRDRNALDLARIGFHADLNVAVFDWMSLSYQLRVVNDPQLVDDLQVQNNLLITLAYTVVKKPEPPPAPDPLAAELAAEKARADAAEARAVAAEARAVAAEQAAATQPGATTAEASEPAPSETTPQQPAEESAPTEPTAPAPADPNEGTATPAVEQP